MYPIQIDGSQNFSLVCIEFQIQAPKQKNEHVFFPVGLVVFTSIIRFKSTARPATVRIPLPGPPLNVDRPKDQQRRFDSQSQFLSSMTSCEWGGNLQRDFATFKWGGAYCHCALRAHSPKPISQMLKGK